MRTPQQTELTDQVRRSGLRATAGRVATLDYVTAHPHSTSAEIHAGLSGRLPAMSMQSIHNAVNDMTEKGLLRKLELPGAARYETRTGDNHHHIRCIKCGRLEDVDCVVGEAPCLDLEHREAMPVVLSADVTFQAVCADCLAAEEAP